VARDEPQVSFGGMLEQAILGKFWESHRSGSHDKSAKKKCMHKVDN
jgi:hypothetical protein